MPHPKTPPKIAAKIDARSNELIAEFTEHRKSVQENYPQFTDQHSVFEGWAIQKIAGLQCLVIDLAEQIASLQKRDNF